MKNVCITCKATFDPYESGEWLFCRECYKDRVKQSIIDSIIRINAILATCRQDAALSKECMELMRDTMEEFDNVG